MSKELFALSNAELKARCDADGIEYAMNATKRDLVRLLSNEVYEDEKVGEENVSAAGSSLSEDEIVAKDAVAAGESVSAGVVENTVPGATEEPKETNEEALIKVIALKDDVIERQAENLRKAEQDNNTLRGQLARAERERDDAQTNLNKLATSGPGHIDDLPKLGQ